METSVKDPRNYHRHKLDDSIAITTRDIFQVIDLSKGGFSFSCPENTHIPDSWEADILTSAGSLDNYGVQLVWISTAKNGNYKRLSRIVGAKFRHLTETQNAKLETLINAISYKKLQYSPG